MRPGKFLSVETFRLRENQIFLALTVLIGIFGGLSAVLFTLAIEGTKHVLFGSAPSALRLVAIPTLVSLVTGFLLAKFFPEARGSGLPQVEAAYHLENGVIPGRVIFGKFFTGALCVGSGHSMGREGPSVQIGAGIASLFGRWLKLSPERVRSLIPIGAAAALSAAFNTPVAAVLFALEEVMGDMNAALIGSTVVASVTAVIIERSILGEETLFRVPAYHLAHPAELIGYAVLGIVGGIVSLLFTQGLLRTRGLFRRLPAWTRIIQPAMGGLAIGIMLLFVPQVMGVGYQYVDQALDGALALRMLLLFCGAKLVATIISYSSGNAGGIFAPSLFLGAMAGGAVGIGMHAIAPFPTGDPGAYALVGMGALFAGIIRAPMTSVFMIFELTQDYQILVPLMVANLLAYAIATRFQPKPIYHALLEQDGIHLPGPASRFAAGASRAGDIMTPARFFLSEDSSVREAAQAIGEQSWETFLVGSRKKIAGLVTRHDIDEAIRVGRADASIKSLLVAEWAHVHADHSLDLALQRFRQTPGLLPVLSRGEATRVEGVITLETIIEFVRRTPQD
ncbi:MAG: chloride channel protein [Thermoanaerobaculia bacterium]